MQALPKGVFALTLTPYTENLEVDYTALKALIDWYRSAGCAGLFALCATSEMEQLSVEERVKMAEFFVKHSGGMKIVCSGHVSASPADQLAELRAIASAGVDGLVLIKHRLHTNEGGAELDNDAAFENLKRLCDGLQDTPLGFYEQPYDGKYKLLPDDWVRWCAADGRFNFIKDTTCTIEDVRRKVALTNGSPFQIYNANGTFFYDTLLAGAAGYSGNFSNYCPDLFVWVCENFEKHPETAKLIGRFLSVFSRMHEQYPLSAKYFVQQLGLPVKVNSRRTGMSMDSLQLRARMDHFAEVLDFLRTVIRDAENAG